MHCCRPSGTAGDPNGWQHARRRAARLDRVDRHPGGRHRAAQPRPVPARRRSRPAAATLACWPTRRSSSASRWSRWPAKAPYRGRRRRCGRGRLSRPRAGQRGCRRCSAGPDAVAELAAWPCDVVLNAVTGAVGLAATLAALDAGRTLALANKESLIVGGPLVPGRAAPGQIVPVDSEHSALAQCLRGGRAAEVRQLVLTASGGPFRTGSRDELDRRHARAGARAPDLEHGPGDHDQLGHAGQQGPGGDRGAPAVRHRLRPTSTSSCTRSRSSTRWSSSPTARRSPRPARRTCGCRSRWRWAGRTGCPTPPPPCDWTHGARPGRSSRWTTRRSRRSRWPGEAGAAGGTCPAVYNAANEECVGGVPGAARIPFTGIVDTVARVVSEHDGSGRVRGRRRRARRR